VIFSERKEYTEADPLKIRLEEGVHEIVGYTDEYGHRRKVVRVTCSHITFVGNGKDHTTIRGGFKVHDQQNVKFEELAITNQNGHGLYLRGSETTVDVLQCAAKACGGTGMYIDCGATITATRCAFLENGGDGVYCGVEDTTARLNECTMHHNRWDGLQADDHAVVDLHGPKTDIHSNKGDGIRATDWGKVNVHLPSQHNTSHDNVGDNRNQEAMYGGVAGSIANINADGTFTHIVVGEDGVGDY